jgi:hypothetical protein
MNPSLNTCQVSYFLMDVPEGSGFAGNEDPIVYTGQHGIGDLRKPLAIL